MNCNNKCVPPLVEQSNYILWHYSIVIRCSSPWYAKPNIMHSTFVVERCLALLVPNVGWSFGVFGFMRMKLFDKAVFSHGSCSGCFVGCVVHWLFIYVLDCLFAGDTAQPSHLCTTGLRVLWLCCFAAGPFEASFPGTSCGRRDCFTCTIVIDCRWYRFSSIFSLILVCT